MLFLLLDVSVGAGMCWTPAVMTVLTGTALLPANIYNSLKCWKVCKVLFLIDGTYLNFLTLNEIDYYYLNFFIEKEYFIFLAFQ